MADDEVGHTYKDIVLSKTDLDTLGGPHQIISFYFSYLSSSFDSEDHILLLPPSVSDYLVNYCQVAEDARVLLEPLELSRKKLVLFPVNDNEHWSLLVYGRKMNAFVHHDSMEGVNNLHATKFYEAVKGFMGSAVESSLTMVSKGRNKKRKKGNMGKETISLFVPSAELPCFLEGETPQQSNGYDSGLYVMAIARAICEWHSSKRKGHDDSWFSAVEEKVDGSLELKLRTEITRLIEDLKVDVKW